jgi:hypothetical protein
MYQRDPAEINSQVQFMTERLAELEYKAERISRWQTGNYSVSSSSFLLVENAEKIDVDKEGLAYTVSRIGKFGMGQPNNDRSPQLAYRPDNNFESSFGPGDSPEVDVGDGRQAVEIYNPLLRPLWKGEFMYVARLPDGDYYPIAFFNDPHIACRADPGFKFEKMEEGNWDRPTFGVLERYIFDAETRKFYDIDPIYAPYNRYKIYYTGKIDWENVSDEPMIILAKLVDGRYFADVLPCHISDNPDG